MTAANANTVEITVDTECILSPIYPPSGAPIIRIPYVLIMAIAPDPITVAPRTFVKYGVK